jgi:D-alanyl-lipoteichoic acid acyltransferase DltB (MBOAT superfamily)
MPSPLRFAAAIAVLMGWVAAGWVCLRLPLRWRASLFALLNIGTVAALSWLALSLHPTLFAAYLAMLIVHYYLVRHFAAPHPWLVFSVPIAYLVLLKYVAFVFPSLRLLGVPAPLLGSCFIGLSYMAFRLSHLVIEVRNGVVPMPDLAAYLGYAFFVPTILVGPISPYHLHQQSLQSPESPVGRALMRIVVGATKYIFLAHLADRLSFRGLMLDGHPHGWLDLAVAAVAYYLYLYCNFSGFCDLAIGAAGLAGIRVAENFDNPLAARNVKEFWNRWHITLSIWMRDVMFTPLSKAGARVVGPSHAIAIATVIVFVTVGVWHGVGWGFFLFGVLHAAGVVCAHYYGLVLKEILGKKGMRAYLDSLPVRGMAIFATQHYVAATFFFFANDGVTMRRILAAVTLRSSFYDPTF